MPILSYGHRDPHPEALLRVRICSGDNLVISAGEGGCGLQISKQIVAPAEAIGVIGRIPAVHSHAAEAGDIEGPELRRKVAGTVTGVIGV